MKKTLLLSVVASTMIMAGGDIAPVEPVVETPAVAVATSGWDFSGQAVVYYQTSDRGANVDLLDKEGASAAAGLQLSAVNKDLFAGIGAGVEVSGISDVYLFPEVVSGLVQSANNAVTGGDLINDDISVDSGAEITQAYLTYAVDNTSFKLGRQQLPKALSPFAFSESWNVFKNTFDAALVVNSDIQDTTLVYAFVKAANTSLNLGVFNELNDSDGVHMLTVQNKSVAGLTLTGTGYFLAGQNGAEDTTILWGDAQFKVSDYTIGLQGGTIMNDDLADDAVAYGVKVGAKFGAYNACVAFSSTDENAPFTNVGGVKTPLYTQMIANQGTIQQDADYIKVAASTKALNGKIGVAYGYAINHEDDTVGGLDNNPYELDVTYSTKVLNGSTTLFAGYVMQNADLESGDYSDLIRVWGRYNF